MAGLLDYYHEYDWPPPVPWIARRLLFGTALQGGQMRPRGIRFVPGEATFSRMAIRMAALSRFAAVPLGAMGQHGDHRGLSAAMFLGIRPFWCDRSGAPR